jgi:hypothetical protein
LACWRLTCKSAFSLTWRDSSNLRSHGCWAGDTRSPPAPTEVPPSHQLNPFSVFPSNDRIPGRAAATQTMPMPGGLTVPETPCLFSESDRLDSSGWTGRRRARSIQRLLTHRARRGQIGGRLGLPLPTKRMISDAQARRASFGVNCVPLSLSIGFEPHGPTAGLLWRGEARTLPPEASRTTIEATPGGASGPLVQKPVGGDSNVDKRTMGKPKWQTK